MIAKETQYERIKDSVIPTLQDARRQAILVSNYELATKINARISKLEEIQWKLVDEGFN
jgi:hypothetical protein